MPNLLDLTPFTKVDPNGRFAQNGLHLIDTTQLTRNETAGWRFDFGANFFTGDQDFHFRARQVGDASAGSCVVVLCGLQNVAGDLNTVGSVDNVDNIYISSQAPNPAADWTEFGVGYARSGVFAGTVYGNLALEHSVDYWLVFRRRKNEGANGRLYLDIFHDEDEKNKETTIFIDPPSWVDYSMMYAVNSYNTGDPRWISAQHGNFHGTPWPDGFTPHIGGRRGQYGRRRTGAG
jgi:hypothetical protein